MQHDLLSPEPLTVLPDANWSEPLLWIRRMVIWEDADTVVRSISLRKGLNVIWSPDASPTDRESIGHGSGKTTFCRLLRYCLGEDEFAPDGQRQGIWESLPEGSAGAEIVLNGKVWSVVRPLSVRRRGRDFVIDGPLPESSANDGTGSITADQFWEMINAAVVGQAAHLMPKTVGSENAWSAALAWMTRDQDCRFSNHLDWRYSRTQSPSKSGRSVEDRLAVVRALIGALSRAELDEKEKQELLDSELTRLQAAETDAERAIQRLSNTLSPSLGSKLISETGLALPFSPAKPVAEERLNEALRLRAGISLGDLEKLRLERKTASAKATSIEVESQNVTTQLLEKRELLRTIISLLPKDQARLAKEQHPICPLCEVPIDRIKAEGCGISTETCDLQALQARITSLTASRRQSESEILALQNRAPQLKYESAQAQQALEAIERKIVSIESALLDRSNEVLTAQRLVDDVERLLLIVKEKATSAENVKKGSAALKASHQLLEEHRSLAKDAIRRLSVKFDGVLRALVPGAIRGEARLDAKGLGLTVRLGGVRSTAAIESLKVVAFDLACLTLAMEGHARLPGFLLHDSPREADLGRSIYNRLFEFAKTLESFGKEPLFQYIVTTTTEPPPEFTSEPWLRQRLCGVPASERLLRRDL